MINDMSLITDPEPGTPYSVKTDWMDGSANEWAKIICCSNIKPKFVNHLKSDDRRLYW